MRLIQIVSVRCLAVVAALTLCSAVAASAGETGGLQQVSAHVWAYVGAKDFSPAASFGANAGVVIGEKYALVVDTLISAKEGERLRADIRKLTKLPIKYVVNTHYHLDHAWGNCAFDSEDARIIGGAGSIKLMKERGEEGLKGAAGYGLTPEQIKGTKLRRADQEVDRFVDYDLGGVKVQILSLRHGHCADNLVVWVPEEGVLFAGDLLFAGCHPFMGESDIAGWTENLDFLAQSGAQKIIPGHGPLCTVQDVAQMKDYLLAFDKIAKELRAGKTQAEVKTIAAELAKRLPAQGRDALAVMIETNLGMKYLPAAPAAK